MSQQDETVVINEIASHYEAIMKLLGEDTDREGLVKTPVRAAKAMYYATKGYRENPAEMLRQAIFQEDGSKMVVVKDIEFCSLCEHHLLPFFGTISVGYIPNGKIVGLSKLARLVDSVTHKLQLQERITEEICNEVSVTLGAKGVIVKCNAQHLCMKMRGVEKQDSSTSTIHYEGLFADKTSGADLRNDFYEIIEH